MNKHLVRFSTTSGQQPSPDYQRWRRQALEPPLIFSWRTFLDVKMAIMKLMNEAVELCQQHDATEIPRYLLERQTQCRRSEEIKVSIYELGVPGLGLRNNLICYYNRYISTCAPQHSLSRFWQPAYLAKQQHSQNGQPDSKTPINQSLPMAPQHA